MAYLEPCSAQAHIISHGMCSVVVPSYNISSLARQTAKGRQSGDKSLAHRSRIVDGSLADR